MSPNIIDNRSGTKPLFKNLAFSSPISEVMGDFGSPAKSSPTCRIYTVAAFC